MHVINSFNMKNFGVYLFLFYSIGGIVEGITTYYMAFNCGSTLYLPSSYLNAIRLKLTSSFHYSKNMNCQFTISAKSNEHLMLYFKDMSIESTSFCNNDWLEIHDGRSEVSPYVSGLHGKYCGFSRPPGVYHTSSDSLTLYFRSDSSVQYSGFEMIITRYHTGMCYGNEYDCDNGRCINKSLTCNGYNPCGDYSDCPLVAGAIVGIVIGSVAFVVIVTLCCILLIRRRRRIYRERIVTVHTPATYGTSGTGYNQPVPQQYPTPGTGYNQPAPQQYPSPAGAYQPGAQAPPPPYTS